MAINNLGTGLRPGVTTSTTRPTTPYEGQVIYETDTDLSYVWGGSAWQQVSGGTAVGNSGLVFVSETVVGAAASVTISNCFSSTFDAYQIVFQGIKHGSTVTTVLLQYRGSGTTETGSVYYDGRSGVTWTGSTVVAATNGGTAHNLGFVVSNIEASGASVFIANPKSSLTTTFHCSGMDARAAGGAGRYAAGMCNTTTSYDSLVLSLSTGSFAASGSIAVYGYRKG